MMRRILISSFLVTCLYAVAAVAQKTVDITVIDVGQGDSILIEFPAGANGDRKRMLIDGGDSDSTNNQVIQVLEQNKIDTLDIVVLTHPHRDHYNGLTPVLMDKKYTVNELWWTGEERDQKMESWTDFKTAMADSVRVRKKVMVKQGKIRTIQGAKIEILNAGGEYKNDINNDSIVLLLRYNGVKVLFTGDIEQDEGRDLVKDFCPRSKNKCKRLDVDIIKIPHHGSAELDQRFVKFAAAEYVLISAGEENRHEHPRWSALNTYKKFGAQHFYSTSAAGENHLKVTIGPGKKQISVDSVKTEFSYWRKKERDKPCTNQENRQGNYCLGTWK